MATYQVKSTDTKHFELTQDGVEKGRLAYDSWFSFKAEMTLPDHTRYAVQPKGFWGTTIEIKFQEQLVLDFKMNWKGHILLRTLFDGNEAFYQFRQQGLLKSTFILLDEQETELLNVEPDFKWSRLNYDYQLVAADAFGQLKQQELLLLTAVHCANYYITMLTAAA